MHVVIDDELSLINVFINENVTKVWSFLTEQERLSLCFVSEMEQSVRHPGRPRGSFHTMYKEKGRTERN